MEILTNLSTDSDELAAEPAVSELQSEALKLAPLLRALVPETLDTRVDLYQYGFDAGDGKVFVLRASELLLEQRLQIEILTALVEYTAMKVKAVTPQDDTGTVRTPMTLPQIAGMLDTFPSDIDVGQLLYRLLRKVEKHHGIGLA